MYRAREQFNKYIGREKLILGLKIPSLGNKKMTNSERRGKYRNIRYEYYHCGRSLMFEGNFFAGGIMLGYAVETTLKAGLLEVLNNEEQKKEQNFKKKP